MAKYVKNKDAVEHTWGGVVIAAGAYYLLEGGDNHIFRGDSEFRTAIQGGSLAAISKTNDGLNDLNAADSEDFLDSDDTLIIRGTLVDSTAEADGTVYRYNDVSEKLEFVSESGLNTGGTQLFIYGDKKKDLKDQFLNSGATNHGSHCSTYIAMADGEVLHVSISTEEDAVNNWFIQIIKNSTKAGSGVFKGGTQIGSDLEKPTAVLDKRHPNLSGYTFSKGDRIACYAKKGTFGTGEAVEPAVTLYIAYTGTIEV